MFTLNTKIIKQNTTTAVTTEKPQMI